MVLSTYSELQKIESNEYKKDINEKKEMKETKLPKNKNFDNYNPSNPFLDRSVRSIIDEFVLTWHRIIMELLEFERYEKLKDEDLEFWEKLYIFLRIMSDIFWKADRIFYIGMGFCILSFFVFFILATQ